MSRSHSLHRPACRLFLKTDQSQIFFVARWRSRLPEPCGNVCWPAIKHDSHRYVAAVASGCCGPHSWPGHQPWGDQSGGIPAERQAASLVEAMGPPGPGQAKESVRWLDHAVHGVAAYLPRPPLVRRYHRQGRATATIPWESYAAGCRQTIRYICQGYTWNTNSRRDAEMGPYGIGGSGLSLRTRHLALLGQQTEQQEASLFSFSWLTPEDDH